MTTRFPIGSFVCLSQGYGEITAYDSAAALFTVKLSNWTLSGGQAVYVSTTVDQLNPIVGLTTTTPFGEGQIVEVAPVDNLYKVRLSSWVLSNDQPVYVFSTGHGLTVDYTQPQPVDIVPTGTKVTTMYGSGEVLGHNFENGLYTVKLSSWTLSNDQSVYVYTTRDGIETPLALGDRVVVSQGPGVITDYDEKTEIYTITLTNWVLSEGRRVYVYTTRENIGFEEEGVVVPRKSFKATQPTQQQQQQQKGDDEQETETCGSICVIV